MLHSTQDLFSAKDSSQAVTRGPSVNIDASNNSLHLSSADTPCVRPSSTFANSAETPKDMVTNQQSITEIVLPSNGTFANSRQTELIPEGIAQSILFPTLAYLSQSNDQRWLTWINPPKNLHQDQLSRYGFDLSKLRLVYVRKGKNLFETVKLSLLLGTSHTIVCNAEKLSTSNLSQLDGYAAIGRCHGMLLRNR